MQELFSAKNPSPFTPGNAFNPFSSGDPDCVVEMLLELVVDHSGLLPKLVFGETWSWPHDPLCDGDFHGNPCFPALASKIFDSVVLAHACGENLLRSAPVSALAASLAGAASDIPRPVAEAVLRRFSRSSGLPVASLVSALSETFLISPPEIVERPGRNRRI